MNAPPSTGGSHDRPTCGETNVVQYGNVSSDLAEIYSPPRGIHAPVAVLVHGGGWATGDRTYMCSPAKALQTRGFITINIDYPPATTTQPGWPIELNSVKAALDWTIAHVSAYGGDPHHIVVLGESAGANLAYLAGLQIDARHAGAIRAIAGLSAPTDLTALASDNADVGLRRVAATYLGCRGERYGACTTRTERAASPVFNIAANCPAFFIANGAAETIVPIAQARRMEHALQAAKCSVTVDYYPGGLHTDWSSEASRIPDWLWAHR